MDVIKPDAEAMKAHLRHLFSHHCEYADGKIELAWTDDKGAVRFADYFDTVDINELVARAVELNSRPQCNVYIGAALRKPDCPPMGRSTDDDFYALTAVYVDLDDAGVAEKAPPIYGDMKPTFAVVTGTHPHIRAQLWWLIEEPVTNPENSTKMLRAVADKLSGDRLVCNPGRIMRLGGSIAWPIKPGRQTELTQIQHISDTPVNLDALQRVLARSPGVPQQRVTVDHDGVTWSVNGLGMKDKVIDGRRTYMLKTILGHFISWVGENGCEPTVADLMETAWRQYEHKVDFTRPGRGNVEFEQEVESTLDRFSKGDLKLKNKTKLPDVEAVVAYYNTNSGNPAGEQYIASANDDWPEPNWRFLNAELPPAPDLPLDEVFSPEWAKWVREAAECKAAPPDYVVFSVLTVFSSLIGNARWVSPWGGWAEPPVLWSMLIGLPSSSKSPALDAVLSPLKQVEGEQRAKVEEELAEWRQKAEVAKLIEAKWKEEARAALGAGKEAPAKPDGAHPGPEPHLPSLSVTDSTIEKLALILSKQPKGVLLFRDEMSGWLQSMTRYSGGGSDRPFWLEAYGGRSYTQQRINRDTVYVPHLSIGVTGGIQPDRLKDLLRQDDDGLTARLLPIWPDPAPVRRPATGLDEVSIGRAIRQLMKLNMIPSETGGSSYAKLMFNDDAASEMQALRMRVREWENEAEGLLRSFVGKLPGTSARLSLILAYMKWAWHGGPEPDCINVDHFGRAVLLVERYILPMAKRAYAEASESQEEKAARYLVHLIRERHWHEFSSSEVYKLNRKLLTSAKEVDKATSILEEADIIRRIAQASGPQGGRPSKRYQVNPAIWDALQDAAQ